MYTKSQQLALRVSAIDPSQASISRKTKLLSYISNNTTILDAPNSHISGLFELYLDNLCLPHKDVTAALLSTHFNLFANAKRSNPLKRLVVFDVYPILDDTKLFAFENMQLIMSYISQVKCAGLTYNLRMCDPLRDSGEVIWFDPFEDGCDMSVRWEGSLYTVRSFYTTRLMCEAGRKIWSDYAISGN